MLLDVMLPGEPGSISARARRLRMAERSGVLKAVYEISQDKTGNLIKTLISFRKKPGGLKSFNQSATVFDT